MDHDLSGLLENPNVKFTEPQIKCYMLQLLEGLRYLHDNQILHRDMKAANLLINNKGILQIADFGLARHYDEPVPQPGKGGGEARREYTTLVVTRWYRPPELLLHLRRYTTAIDLWGVGWVYRFLSYNLETDITKVCLWRNAHREADTSWRQRCEPTTNHIQLGRFAHR